MFRGTPKHGPQLIRLHLPKCGLAQSLENFRNGQARGLFDASVEIYESPGKLTGQ
jgi:hypothetical protein